MIGFFDFVSSLYVIEIDFINRALFKEVQVSSNLNHPIPENWQNVIYTTIKANQFMQIFNKVYCRVLRRNTFKLF